MCVCVLVFCYVLVLFVRVSQLLVNSCWSCTLLCTLTSLAVSARKAIWFIGVSAGGSSAALFLADFGNKVVREFGVRTDQLYARDVNPSRIAEQKTWIVCTLFTAWNKYSADTDTHFGCMCPHRGPQSVRSLSRADAESEWQRECHRLDVRLGDCVDIQLHYITELSALSDALSAPVGWRASRFTSRVVHTSSRTRGSREETGGGSLSLSSPHSRSKAQWPTAALTCRRWRRGAQLSRWPVREERPAARNRLVLPPRRDSLFSWARALRLATDGMGGERVRDDRRRTPGAATSPPAIGARSRPASRAVRCARALLSGPMGHWGFQWHPNDLLDAAPPIVTLGTKTWIHQSFNYSYCQLQRVLRLLGTILN